MHVELGLRLTVGIAEIVEMSVVAMGKVECRQGVRGIHRPQVVVVALLRCVSV
jgi:hypothetical protein